MATMTEAPAAAVGGRGCLPAGGATGGSLGAEAHSRIHHIQPKPHNSSQDNADTQTPSASSAPPAGPAEGSSSSSYAFITHSQEGLRENRPPMIDNAGLAPRRRRRTSQHDQAILEEQYRKCDRPDKAKRREIAAMVELGDKEVQIWFQNKRQSARRKLKPLLPHEIIPNAMKSSSSPAPAYQHHYYHHQPGYTNVGSEELREEEERGQQDKCETEVEKYKKFLGRTLGCGAGPDENVQYTDQAEGGREDREHEADPGSSQDQGFSSQSSSQNHGYYSQQETPARGERGHDRDTHTEEQKLPPATARRMSMSHMRLQEALSSPLRPPPPPPAKAAAKPLTSQPTHPRRRSSFVREPPSELSEYIHSDFPQQQHTPIKSLPPPSLALPTPQATNPRRTNPQNTYQPPTLQKRSSSFLRLSTSLDGHAEVVIDTEPTLPPPLADLMTPRRAAPIPPVPSTSSVLRDIDNMRAARVWEYCCDKQQQAYLGSEGSSSGGLHPPPHHHHHHSALEPDEAGMALSIARRRRKMCEFKDTRRKLVFDDAELLRDDSGLGGMINSPKSNAALPGVKKPPVGKDKVTKPKKRVSLGEVSSHTPNTAKPSTYPSTASTTRKRAYAEIEIFRNQALPARNNAIERRCADGKSTSKMFSSPRARAGGEDYYIFGHESDKENNGLDAGKGEGGDSHGGDGKVNGESGKQRQVKPMKKPIDREKMRTVMEKVPLTPLGVVGKKVKQKAAGDGPGVGVGRMRDVDERRVKKKRKVLGEVGEHIVGGGMKVKEKEKEKEEGKGKEMEMEVERERSREKPRLDSDVDLGGAELLLSLSAGSWGC